jgi:hypothetical protein
VDDVHSFFCIGVEDSGNNSPQKEVIVMVKGVSRQVIVVQSPDKEMFEQAIFILSDTAVQKGVTDQMLLKQANQAIRAAERKRPGNGFYGPICAAAGAAVTAIVWILTALL